MAQRSTNASKNKEATPDERLDRAETQVERIERKVAQLAEALEQRSVSETVAELVARLHEAVDAIENAYTSTVDFVRTRRLEVVDDEGTVRAVIGQLDSTFGLTISDEHGAKRAFLNTDTDGPGLYLAGNGNIRATVTVSEGLEGRASISLMDGGGDAHSGLDWNVLADGSVVISQPDALRWSPGDS